MGISMLQWSLIFFCAAALIGFYMLLRFLTGYPRHNGSMLLHGLFAGFGIGCLFYYSAFELKNNVPYISIFFFIVAVFGGVFMAMWDKIMNRKMPRYFPIFHACAAIAGIVTLIVFMFTHS